MIRQRDIADAAATQVTTSSSRWAICVLSGDLFEKSYMGHDLEQTNPKGRPGG